MGQAEPRERGEQPLVDVLVQADQHGLHEAGLPAGKQLRDPRADQAPDMLDGAETGFEPEPSGPFDGRRPGAVHGKHPVDAPLRQIAGVVELAEVAGAARHIQLAGKPRLVAAAP